MRAQKKASGMAAAAIKHLSVALAVLVLGGCVRGESKSLDEIYQLAKESFLAASTEGMDPRTAELLSVVTKALEMSLRNASQKEVEAALQEITAALTELIPMAGYTVRPALTELRNQYLELQKMEDISPAQVRLIVMRTYTALTQELLAHKFKNP